MALGKRQLKTITLKILSEKERLLESFDVDQDKFIVKSDDNKDEVDQAAAEYERSQMLRFRNRDIFYSKKLDKALEKIKTLEFGECEECGEGIRFERLLARPTAELCISCKDESEREEHSNIIGKQSKSLGEKISLVSSY